MLAVGDPIPEVTLLDLDCQPVRVAGLTERGPALVCFHSFDWTDSADDQLQALRNRHEEFVLAGVELVGVSRDSPYTHTAYARRQSLGYPLLSDWSGDALRAFGIGHTSDGLTDVPRPACFLLAGAEVAGVWAYDERPVDVDELIAAVSAL